MKKKQLCTLWQHGEIKESQFKKTALMSEANQRYFKWTSQDRQLRKWTRKRTILLRKWPSCTLEQYGEIG